MHSSMNHAPRADTTCEGGQPGACEGGVGIMMESRLHACRGASFSLLLDPDVGDRGREELLGATQPKTCNVSPASAQHRGLGTHFWGRGSSIRIGPFGRWPLREGCRPRQSATDTFTFRTAPSKPATGPAIGSTARNTVRAWGRKARNLGKMASRAHQNSKNGFGSSSQEVVSFT